VTPPPWVSAYDRQPYDRGETAVSGHIRAPRRDGADPVAVSPYTRPSHRLPRHHVPAYWRESPSR